MAIPNLLNTSSVYGQCTGKILTTGSQDIITNTANQTIKINTFLATNITASAVTVTIGYYENSTTTTFYILYQTQVPANGSLDVFNRPFYLKESDKITALAGAGTSIHVVASWESLA
jgi:hypothetical protein